MTETFKTVKDPEGKKQKVKESHCRFKFPFELNGFKNQFNKETGELEGIVPNPSVKDDPLFDPLTYGASYRRLDEKTQTVINTNLELLRNHPDLNNHIAEILILWAANVDQKCIGSYDQVVQYLLKYVLKPEKQSNFFTALKTAIAKKTDEDTPLNKTAQKVLMSCIGQRDMTTNECFLIAHGLPYVDFSHKPRTANLKGSFVAKSKVKAETETIVDDNNWQESYWKKEEIEGYKTLCSDYEAGKVPVLDKHPKDLSLREFMCNFTKKWKYCPADVFPYFIPTFRYVVNKKKKHYEDYCRCLLLQDKPGCTFDNVGKEFESCEEELRDFVENSPLCPNLVKEEFKESQRGGENPEQNQDPFIGGDFLYMDDEEDPERAPRDDVMELYALNDDDQAPEGAEELLGQNDEVDDSNPTDGDESPGNKIASDNIDKDEHRLKLGLTQDDILASHDFIKKMKELHGEEDTEEEDVNCLEKDQLNFKQRIAYDLLEDFVNQKMTEDGKDATLYLNISGKAGCGKSAVLKCISKYIRSKAKPNFMKIGAPTGTAAFLVNGKTLHFLFQLPVNKSTASKNKISELKGDQLRSLQKRFENVELLVIDEKSMIGQYMLYMIEERLRQAKPKNADKPFGGVSIVLMGDFAQLAPVMDPPLFMEPDIKSKNSSNPQIVTGHQLFKTHFSENSLIFDEVLRQGPDQKEFKKILENISNGQLSLEEWEHLRTRELSDRNFMPEEMKSIRNNSIKVCAIKKDCEKHNIYRIKALGKPIHGIKSLNTGKDAKNASESDAGGLVKEINLAEGSRVLLKRNLWQSRGLCNGSIGEVKYIVYPEKSSHQQLQLPIVIVQFPSYTGPWYLKDVPNSVPIVVQENHFTRGQEQCTRRMLPLLPGYAISIHSSQGAELESVIVNVGPQEFAAGLVYVALSRVRRIQNLYFEPYPKRPRFLSVGKTKVFAQRLKQDEREKKSDARYALLARQNDSN